MAKTKECPEWLQKATGYHFIEKWLSGALRFPYFDRKPWTMGRLGLNGGLLGIPRSLPTPPPTPGFPEIEEWTEAEWRDFALLQLERANALEDQLALVLGMLVDASHKKSRSKGRLGGKYESAWTGGLLAPHLKRRGGRPRKLDRLEPARECWRIKFELERAGKPAEYKDAINEYARRVGKRMTRSEKKTLSNKMSECKPENSKT